MMYLLKFTGEMEPQNVKLEYHNVCSALMPFLLTEHFHILSQQYVISDSCPVLKVETNLNKAVKETWLLLSCHIIKISLDSILKTNVYVLGLGLRYKKIISFVICHKFKMFFNKFSCSSFNLYYGHRGAIRAWSHYIGVSSNSPFYFRNWMRI